MRAHKPITNNRLQLSVVCSSHHQMQSEPWKPSSSSPDCCDHQRLCDASSSGYSDTDSSFCCCPLDLFHGGWFANPVWSDVCTCYWFLLGVVNNHSWCIALDAHRALFIKAERFNCALCSDCSERCGFVWKNLLNWRKFARSKLNLISRLFCLKTKLRRRRRYTAARSWCNIAQFLMTLQRLPFQNVTESRPGYLPDFVFHPRLIPKILLWLIFLQFDSYALSTPLQSFGGFFWSYFEQRQIWNQNPLQCHHAGSKMIKVKTKFQR